MFGDPVLRTPADRSTDFDKELRTLVDDLDETMLDAPGSASPRRRSASGLRVFTYHIDEGQSGHLVNPVLHFPSDEEQDGEEGCLSIPGMASTADARSNVVAHGQNMYGDPVTVEGTRCSPAACSTRPTTSTACCSSTGSTP